MTHVSIEHLVTGCACSMANLEIIRTSISSTKSSPWFSWEEQWWISKLGWSMTWGTEYENLNVGKFHPCILVFVGLVWATLVPNYPHYFLYFIIWSGQVSNISVGFFTCIFGWKFKARHILTKASILKLIRVTLNPNAHEFLAHTNETRQCSVNKIYFKTCESCAFCW